MEVIDHASGTKSRGTLNFSEGRQQTSSLEFSDMRLIGGKVSLQLARNGKFQGGAKLAAGAMSLVINTWRVETANGGLTSVPYDVFHGFVTDASNRTGYRCDPSPPSPQ
jgi:hypothetical protein